MVKCHTLINRRNKCLLIVFIVLIGWIIFRPKAYTYSLNDKEKEMLIMLSQHPETRYFGFYSIELPADYKPTGMVMFIQGSAMIPVETKLQYYPPFLQYMTQYEAELKNTSALDPLDTPYLKQVHPLSPPMNGVIFERMKAKYTPDFARVLDAWKWENGVTFSVKIEAKDGRATRYDGISKIAEYSYGYNIPEKKVQLLTILSGLQPRADNQPPSENKLAIQYAQVDASLLGEYELSVDYKNSNNIKISLQTDNNSYIDSLLDIRYPSNGNRAWYNSI
ncbi:TPA: hypothetical protein ACUKVN_000497 [Escherichia coli]